MNSHQTISGRLAPVAAFLLAGLLAACNSDNTTPTAATASSQSTTTGPYASAPADTSSSSTTATNGTTSDRSDHSEHAFWKKAKGASQREYAYSQLAIAQASDMQVRSLAQQIVSDHERMAQDFRSTKGHDLTMDDSDMSGTYSATNTHTGAATGDSSMAAQPGSGMSTSASGTTYNPDATGRTDMAAGNSSGAPTSSDTSNHTGPVTGDSLMAPQASSGMSTSASGTTYNPDAATRQAQIASDARRNGSTSDNHHVNHDDWVKSDHAYSKLATKSGSDFDRAYLDLIVEQEEKFVSLCEKAGQAKDNSDSDVQSFANNHLAMHRQRLEQAKALQNSRGQS